MSASGDGGPSAVAVARRLDALATALRAPFAAAGYEDITPEDIVPRHDPTLTFTNSAVVPFKPYLTGERRLGRRGVVVCQPCIRSFNLDVVQAAELRTQYLLHFRMFGALGTSASEVTRSAVSGLSRAGLDVRELRCAASAEDAELVLAWREHDPDGTRTALDADEPDYYEWVFGLPGVTGRGTTIYVHRANAKRRALGNVIAFTTSSGAELFGFGAGLETVDAAIRRHDWVIASSPAGQGIPAGDRGWTKLADLLWMLTAAQAGGVRPRSSGAGAVFKKALRASQGLLADLEIGERWLRRHLSSLATAAGAPAHTAEQLVAALVPSSGASRHLSFSCPKTISPEAIVRAVECASGAGWRTEDPEVLDLYEGPQLDEDRYGVTIGVRIVFDHGPEGRAEVTEAAEEVVKAVQQGTGARLRRG